MAGSVIGALRVSLSAETAAFDKGIDRSKTKLQQFDRDTKKMASGVRSLGDDMLGGLGPVGTVLDKIGAAGLVAGVGVGAAVVAFQGMKDALRFADDLAAASTKIGITAEQLQELTFAAHENDITTEALKGSLEGLNATLGAYKAGVGDAKVKKVFEALGITRESLKDVNNAADFLPILADRIKTLQSTAERVKIAKALGVEDMVPLLEKGGAEIERLTGKARDLGLVMSNELTAKAADANRELEVMGEYISAHLSIAFADMGVWIVDVTKKMNPLIQAVRDFNQARLLAVSPVQQINSNPVGVFGLIRQGAANLAFQATHPNGVPGAPAPVPHSTPPVVPAAATGGTATGSGGGRARSSSASAAKPRFNGPLPDYIKKGVADGRYTEASIREWYPDGNFPKDGFIELPPAMTFVEAVNAAAKAETVNGINIDTSPDGLQSSADRMNEATAGIVAATEQGREAFRDMFTGGLLAALHDGKDGVREWMRQGAERGLEEALNNLADVIFNLFSQMGSGSTGGFGSALSGLFGSMFGGFSSALPGFATGGNFTVGGNGGTDSQLVQFRATPGEMVNITHGNDNGPMGMQVFDMRGAVVTQDLLNQVNEKVARGNAQVLGQVASASAMRDKAARYRVAR